ncbi:MAG: hypothetical protein JSR60_01290 [Proteobacteria bacterium]|nr:hypothetical protein [Pseudomonadota bacterium]
MTEAENEIADGELDRLLAGAAAPSLPVALERRVLADFDRIAARPSLLRSLRRLADAVWPDAPLWQPACALALALMLGAGIATLAPVEAAAPDQTAFAFDGQPDLTPQDF